MSVRAANYPLEVPAGIEIDLKDQDITVKGQKGILSFRLHPTVEVAKTDKGLVFSTSEKKENGPFVGTAYARVKSMIEGILKGFEKRLELVGVGYRAQLNDKNLELNLGFSHLIHYLIPEGITASVDKQTSIIIQGIDKQKVGQVAAEIRDFRPVEPYKGKGVRYSDEKVITKEVKKK